MKTIIIKFRKHNINMPDNKNSYLFIFHIFGVSVDGTDQHSHEDEGGHEEAAFVIVVLLNHRDELRKSFQFLGPVEVQECLKSVVPGLDISKHDQDLLSKLFHRLSRKAEQVRSFGLLKGLPESLEAFAENEFLLLWKSWMQS